MRIGILETGRPTPALAEGFGTYADMVAALLRDVGDAEFLRFWLQDDEFPASAEVCDAWAITGSRSSATEDAPWMLRLQDLLREAKEKLRPVIGICFGHQILARTFGGEVRKADNGWQLGPQSYELTARPFWLAEAGERLCLNAIHEDQVLTVPSGATLLASSPACPIAALSYGDWAVSFQAHPEFSVDFEKALLETFTGVSLPLEEGRDALKRLGEPGAAADAALIARGLARFLRGRG